MARTRGAIDILYHSKCKSAAESRIDDQKFPLLALPNEMIFEIYAYLDYATRRALRVKGKLAEIEKLTKYRCERMKIHDTVDYVVINFDDVKVRIPHSEVKKEFELMRAKTSLKSVIYRKYPSPYSPRPPPDRPTLNEICLLKAKKMTVRDREFNDSHLESVIMNVDHAYVETSAVTEDGIMRLYEKMREHQLEGKRVTIYRDNVNELWSIMEKLGTLNRETLRFTATNPNHRTYYLIDGNGSRWIKLEDGNRMIYFVGVNPNWVGRRYVRFGTGRCRCLCN